MAAIEGALGPRDKLRDFDAALANILTGIGEYKSDCEIDRERQKDDEFSRRDARRRLKSALSAAQKLKDKIEAYREALGSGIYFGANDEECDELLKHHLNTDIADRLIAAIRDEAGKLTGRRPYKLRRDQLWEVFADAFETLTGTEARKGIAKPEGTQPKGPFISFMLATNKLLGMKATANAIEMWHRRNLVLRRKRRAYARKLAEQLRPVLPDAVGFDLEGSVERQIAKEFRG